MRGRLTFCGKIFKKWYDIVPGEDSQLGLGYDKSLYYFLLYKLSISIFTSVRVRCIQTVYIYTPPPPRLKKFCNLDTVQSINTWTGPCVLQLISKLSSCQKHRFFKRALCSGPFLYYIHLL